jgi:hypothetical protein
VVELDEQQDLILHIREQVIISYEVKHV